MADDKTAKREVHWAKTRNLTYVVLIIWALAGIVAPWFAKELNAFTFLGFKLGYYMLVQGSLIIFLLLIIVHNMMQDSIDDQYGSGDV